MNISPEEYIAERVEQYQAWYDKKAVATKKFYLWMRAFSVGAGGLVPVLINIPQSAIIQGIVTVISLLVVVAVSLESVFHYREQWKNYRSTEQLLGHEKFLFRSRVGRYQALADEEAFRSFVERVEELIATENSATLNVMTMASETADSLKRTEPKQP